MRKVLYLTLLVVCCLSYLSAQGRLTMGTTAATTASAPDTSGLGATPEDRLRLAISSIDYPVTPGDVYMLTYRQSAGSLINLEVLIDGVGVIDLGVFGKINANGMTFVQLKQKVEELIAKNYTYSLPNLSINTPGIFRVIIRDGASRIQYRTAWGLSRLSEVVEDFQGAGVSLRSVELIHMNGEPKVYDLLKAALFNESGLDPLVRPGDTVMLHGPGKTVRLQGELRRPGRYEVIKGEGLKDLIEIFGGGLSARADASRVRIDRISEKGERSEYISIPAAYYDNISLNDGDVILIRAKSERLPLVWFEGAVSSTAFTSGGGAEAGTVAAVAPASSVDGAMGRFSYPIREGQMMSDILQDIRPSFLPLADLASATLFTPNSEIGLTVDIQALLSGTDLSTDVALSAGYKIVVPRVQTTVLVTGAVYAPGAVPHRQNAPARYYMTLAGGTDPSRNSLSSYILYDQNGKQKKSKTQIMPGDRIHVRSNAFSYFLERSLPTISSILSLATIIATLAANYWPL